MDLIANRTPLGLDHLGSALLPALWVFFWSFKCLHGSSFAILLLPVDHIVFSPPRGNSPNNYPEERFPKLKKTSHLWLWRKATTTQTNCRPMPAAAITRTSIGPFIGSISGSPKKVVNCLGMESPGSDNAQPLSHARCVHSLLHQLKSYNNTAESPAWRPGLVYYVAAGHQLLEGTLSPHCQARSTCLAVSARSSSMSRAIRIITQGFKSETNIPGIKYASYPQLPKSQPKKVPIAFITA